MKKIALATFAVLLTLAAALHVAQAGEHKVVHKGAMGHGGFEAHLAAALDLTDDQTAEAKKIHQEIFAKAKPIMEQHQQQMEEVFALLDGDSPDATEVGNKMIAAHASKKQIQALHEDGMARFSTLLTAEQKAKLDEIKKSHGGEMGTMRFIHRMHR
jgi:Spy/CpxP family protein refolding chaperone